VIATSPLDAFAQVAARRAAGGAGAWLEGARRAARERGPFAEAFTLAARKVGKATLELRAGERDALAAAGVTWPIGQWGVDELVRAMLLLEAAAHLSTDALATLVDDAYRAADNRERQAVLKALPLLPGPERFLDLAVDACRTSIQPIFEAIACENPYPAAYFPELNWNQMVLKAVFIGVALERTIGLERRLTPELARMARDYASERRAAGRPVPEDLSRLTQEAHP
jgi:hypothetical protein